jgi:hypothetical protein
MKTYFIISFLLIAPTFLFAQLTGEQGDKIVLEYIQNEVTWDYILSRNDNPPRENGKTTVSWKSKGRSQTDSLTVEYPCWSYFIMNPNVNGPYIILFLFVDKNNGTLLEVKNKQAFGANIENWTFIATNTADYTSMDKNSDCVITPNPVSEYLDIACEQYFSHIEIHDSSGKMVLAESVGNNTHYRLNTSSISKGLYFLNIFDKEGEKIKIHKLIKN